MPSRRHNGVDVAPQFTHSRPSANTPTHTHTRCTKHTCELQWNLCTRNRPYSRSVDGGYQSSWVHALNNDANNLHRGGSLGPTISLKRRRESSNGSRLPLKSTPKTREISRLVQTRVDSRTLIVTIRPGPDVDCAHLFCVYDPYRKRHTPGQAIVDVRAVVSCIWGRSDGHRDRKSTPRIGVRTLGLYCRVHRLQQNNKHPTRRPTCLRTGAVVRGLKPMLGFGLIRSVT